MNPEALQAAFQLFVDTGYNGTSEDFVNLINTNEEALKASFNQFVETGYNGSEEDFKNLVGVSGEITKPKKEKEEIIPKKEEIISEVETFDWKPSMSAKEYEALPLMDKERANWEKFKEIELGKQEIQVVEPDVTVDTDAFSSLEDIPDYEGLTQGTSLAPDKDGLYNVLIEDVVKTISTPSFPGEPSFTSGDKVIDKRKANKEEMEVLLPVMDALQKEAFKNLQDYGFSNENALGSDTYTISTEQHAVIKDSIYDKFVKKAGIPIDKGSFDFLYNETIVDNKDQVERDYKSNRIRPESTEVSPEFKEIFVLEADKGKSEVELASDSLKAKQFEITKELNNINNVLIPQAVNRTVDKDESSTKRNRQLDDLNKRKIELENDYKDLDKAIEQNATSTKVIGGWMPGDPLSFQGKPRTYKEINEELNSKFFNMQGRSKESTKKLNKVSQDVENTAGVRAQNLINENPALSQREAVEQLFNDELLYLQQFEADGRNSFVNLKFTPEQLSGGNPMGAKVLRALDANGLKDNIDNNGNINISLYDLRAAGIDSRNFEGYFDELANLISDKDLNAVKMYNEEVDEVTVAARTFRNLAINNVDVGAIEKPDGFVNLLQTGAVATLETLGMNKSEAEEFLTGTTEGTARTQIDNLDRAIKTANNTPDIQASMGGKIELTEDQKENISMSMTEEVTSGIGGFVPDLMILGATGGVMNAMGYAKLISKMSPMAKFITGAVVEEAKMQTILDMKPGGGATFYTLGAATSGIKLKGAFAWLDPLFQKVIKAGPIGAISAEGAGVAELAYESFMGDKNFKAEFDEMYKDFSTVSRRAIVNSMVFGLTGFTHVKRGDFMTTQRKYEVISELKNEVNNLMGQKLDFVDGFSSELKVDKDGVVIPDQLKPKKQFKDLSPKDQKKFAEYTQRIQTLNQEIQAQTMHHKLDPNSKNFEKDFDKMITEPMNRAMKSLVPNFEGVKVKFGRRSDPKTPMFKKNFDSAENTAQYNPKTKEMFFDLDAYTAGKPPHEFTHVALNAYLEANPGMKLNFTKNLGKVFEGFDFGEFEGTELAKRIKERYNIDLRTWKGKNLAAEEYLAFMGEFLADPKVYYSNPDLASTFMNQVRLEVKDFLVEAGLKTPNVKTAKDVVQLLGMIGEKTRMGGRFEVKMQTLAKLDEIDVIGAELVKANREAEGKKVASKDLTEDIKVTDLKANVKSISKENVNKAKKTVQKLVEKAGGDIDKNLTKKEKDIFNKEIEFMSLDALGFRKDIGIPGKVKIPASEAISYANQFLPGILRRYKKTDASGKTRQFSTLFYSNIKPKRQAFYGKQEKLSELGKQERLSDVDTEGREKRDIVSKEATPEEAIIASEERKAKVTPKSKITRDFPEIFTEDLKNEIDKGLLEIFEGEIPGVETKEFKSFITEASRSKLTNKVKKALGGGKNYEFSIKKMSEKMKETLDPRFFVRLESQTKPENRIFTKPPRRLTKQAEIDAAMLNDKVYVENTAQGVNIYEFKDFTPKQLSDYILAPTISPTTGAKSGLRGTRKTAFAEGLVDRLTRDATPQNLKRIGKEPKEIAEISKKMQVDPSTTMASKDLTRKYNTENPNKKVSEKEVEKVIGEFLKGGKEMEEAAINNPELGEFINDTYFNVLEGSQPKVKSSGYINQVRNKVLNKENLNAISKNLDVPVETLKPILEKIVNQESFFYTEDKLPQVRQQELLEFQSSIIDFAENTFPKEIIDALTSKQIEQLVGYAEKTSGKGGESKGIIDALKIDNQSFKKGLKNNKSLKENKILSNETKELIKDVDWKSIKVQNVTGQFKSYNEKLRKGELITKSEKEAAYPKIDAENYRKAQEAISAMKKDYLNSKKNNLKSLEKGINFIWNLGRANTSMIAGQRGLIPMEFVYRPEGFQTMDKRNPLWKKAYDKAVEEAKLNPKKLIKKVGPDYTLDQYATWKANEFAKMKGEHFNPSAGESASEVLGILKGEFEARTSESILSNVQGLIPKGLLNKVDAAFGPTASYGTKRFALKELKDYLKETVNSKGENLYNIVLEQARNEILSTEGLKELFTNKKSIDNINIATEVFKYAINPTTANKLLLETAKNNLKANTEVRNQNIEVAKEASMASKDLTQSEMLNELNKRDKAFRLANERDKTIKKARVFDFDDTIARSKSKVFAERDGKRKTLTAEEFAKQGEKLISEGWKMDFTDFNKVVEGKKGPLFDLIKTMKEAKGERDIFILTARAPESQKAIYEFMKAMGVEIPLENITGLGKSSGQAKADWIIDKASEGYNDFFFADDAPQNVKAVQEGMSRLDVKSKTQLVKASKDLKIDSERDKKKLNWKTDEAGNIKTTFEVAGKKYNFNLDARDNKGSFDVEFNLGGRIDITGTGNAVKVIRTVYNGLLDAVSKNPKIKRLEFSSLKSEQSRVKLYTTLMDRVAKKLGWETDVWESNDFITPEKSSYDFEITKPRKKQVASVEKVLDVIDVKSNTQKNLASKDLSREFNNLIEESTGIGAEKVFSDVKAQVRGAKAKRQRFFIPPSAEDMLGLVYTTLGKGKKGEAHLKFYQENLFDPYTRAMENLSTDRVNLMADFKALKKQLDVPKDLRKTTESGFTNEQAVRVHLWNKMGEKIPGLSKSDLKELNDIVEKDPKLQAFADQILSITKGDGYSKPKENWAVGTITTDLVDVLNTKKRGKYLETWKQNKDLIYSKENLNKLEAAYGPKYRAAIENSLRRMESGSNRLGGGNRLSNQVLDYINNSTGAIMFFNARSAVLQTISAANFINWGFNNPYKAGKAFANQPQYWKDFVELMNSDYLKDRRNGLKLNINESEIANAAKTSGNKAKAALNYILEKGYLPTKYADSFAIASGGATFYRNRINDLIKNEGKTEAEAKEIAMKEFRQVSEMSQQSSDPSKISQQQSSDLGRVVLQFANTPMQYARIQKRAVQDIVNGRGDLKTNISKIAYYGFLQNMLFNGLQQAVTSLGFGDEEMTDAEEKKLIKAANGMLDSSLRGLGMAGVTVQVLKNLGIDIYDRSKRDRPEFTDSYKKLLEFSPAIKSKLGKFQSAAYPFDNKKRRAEVFEKGFSLDNPAYESMAKVITGTTNLPLDRLYSKVNNLSAAMDEETETWQSIAMILGWPEWQIKGKQNYVESPEVKKKKSLEDTFL